MLHSSLAPLLDSGESIVFGPQGPSFLAPRSIFPIENARSHERDYFAMIDRAIKASREEGSKPEYISNSKAAHAVYLIYKFFTEAKSSIQILTGCLAGRVGNIWAYDDREIIDAAKAFLRKEGTSLEIVVLQDKDGSRPVVRSPFLQGIWDDRPHRHGSLSVFMMNPNQSAEPSPHLLLMDGESLRYELDTDSTQAFVTFGNVAYSEPLVRHFEIYKKLSEPLPYAN